MKYQAHFVIKENTKELFDIVAPEKRDLQTERSQVDIELTKEGVEFTITAKDFTAFRAMQNAVMRLLVIHNKMQKIK